MSHLELFSLIVREYDPAIEFFVRVLGFDLIEDSPSLTNDGRPKRWVVVRPPGAVTGLLLARADGEHQAAMGGRQHRGGGWGSRPRGASASSSAWTTWRRRTNDSSARESASWRLRGRRRMARSRS